MLLSSQQHSSNLYPEPAKSEKGFRFFFVKSSLLELSQWYVCVCVCVCVCVKDLHVTLD